MLTGASFGNFRDFTAVLLDSPELLLFAAADLRSALRAGPGPLWRATDARANRLGQGGPRARFARKSAVGGALCAQGQWATW
jgi:hypothetical protein